MRPRLAPLLFRLTGDESFYNDILTAIGTVAIEADFSNEFKDVIKELAQTEMIQNLSN
jgi:hypothetical protein